MYYSVLAEAGVPEAVDIISEGFSDGTPSQKDDAFRALLNVQGMAAADRLLGIASGSEARYAVDALLAVTSSWPAPVRRYGGE